MIGSMEKYSQHLRQLVDDYYRQHMTLFEYRAERKILFDAIESESGDSSNDARKRADNE